MTADAKRETEAVRGGSYHALFWHCSLDFAADYLGQSGTVLRGAEALLRLRAAGLGGGAPRRLAPSLVHVHVEAISLPHCTLSNQ